MKSNLDQSSLRYAVLGNNKPFDTIFIKLYKIKNTVNIILKAYETL